MPYGFQPTPDDYVRQERLVLHLQTELGVARYLLSSRKVNERKKIIAAAFAGFVAGFLCAVWYFVLHGWVNL